MVGAAVESVFFAWRHLKDERLGTMRHSAGAIVTQRFAISPNYQHTPSSRALSASHMSARCCPWLMARSETVRYVCAMGTAAVMVLAITTSRANDINCK